MTDKQKPVDGITPSLPPKNTGKQKDQISNPVPIASGAAPEIKRPEDISPEMRKRMKFILIVLLGVPYIIFFGWCLFLISVLPDPEGTFEYLISIGSMTGTVGAVALFLVAVFSFVRILRKRGTLEPVQLAMSAGRILLVVLPGIIIGVMTPFIISAEPKLWITVTSPETLEEFIAPVAITFSLEDAVTILKRRGVQAVSYGWDFDGDGEKNEDTVLPTATAVYSRKGLYDVVVRIETNDGNDRRIILRLPIQREVFQVTPMRPIVDEPVKFSVAHLVDLPEELKEVQWDFDSDGVVDEVTSDLDTVYTFVRTGTTTVSAIVLMQNQTQQQHKREIVISEPDPLPFEVEIQTEPKILVSPSPFQTIFRVVTEEPIREVKWEFGDEKETELEGVRVGHTFEKKGNFVVTANVKSEIGDLAKLTTLVRVVEELEIPDLTFNGKPDVDLKEGLISGEVPLTLNLTPRSSMSLVEYSWEAPDATSVGSTVNTLEAIYRRPGTYNITLLAQDPAGHAMRMPIRIEVKPPSTFVSIKMSPEGGVSPLKVRFDASETRIPNENISGFEWLFGEEGEEGKPKQGGAAMEYTYETPGTYEVKLFARTTEGKVYDSSRTIVVRPPLLDACFRASRTQGKAPLGVKFFMNCTTGNPTDITWNFGDKTTTDERDPIHVFDDPGTYSVVLKLKDKGGSVSEKTIDITVRE